MVITKSKLTDEILGLLISEGFMPDTAKMVFAQAAHETANFTSDMFRNNKNLFGMKLPETRRTLAIGEHNGHAVYSSIADSISDYRLYYAHFNYPEIWKDIETFIETLKMKGFFTAPLSLYLAGVKYFYKFYFGGTQK